MDIYRKLLVYVRKNKTWTASEELAALSKIGKYHCSLDYADHEISMKVRELIEEFERENDLNEEEFEDISEHDVFTHI